MATRVPAIQVTTSGKRKQLKESSTSQYWFQIPLKYLYELVRYTYMNSFQTPVPVPQMKKKTKKKTKKTTNEPPPKTTTTLARILHGDGKDDVIPVTPSTLILEFRPATTGRYSLTAAVGEKVPGDKIRLQEVHFPQ